MRVDFGVSSFYGVFLDLRRVFSLYWVPRFDGISYCIMGLLWLCCGLLYLY